MSDILKMSKEMAQDLKQARPSQAPWWRTKKVLIIAAVVAALTVIGLAVGLGVGLTRGGDGDEHGESPEPQPPGPGPNRTSIWKPAVGTSWQIILQKAIKLSNDGAVTPDTEVYDLDVFDNDAETFAKLNSSGIKVICYFSAGSYEDWRDDKGKFEQSDMGKPLDGWPGERWLNVSSPKVRSIMKDRIKLAASKGCLAIDPDNVDGYVCELYKDNMSDTDVS